MSNDPANPTTAKERRQYRIDHGLCPECGEEAAPYYLCPRHRRLGSLSRMLKRWEKHGGVEREKRHGKNYWKLVNDGVALDSLPDYKTLFDMDENDKRLRPRLGRRPVDLDETLMSIFTEAGRPLQIEEIYHAWGRLRSKRKTASLAGDMTAIINAQRRREARNAKRAAIAARGYPQ